MNRRGFLSLFGAAAGAAVVAPLVPVPDLAEMLVPTRTIFLPPRGGWIGGNRLLSVKEISLEMLRVFTVTMEFTSSVNRDYSIEFSNDGGVILGPPTLARIRVGDPITIAGVRRP